MSNVAQETINEMINTGFDIQDILAFASLILVNGVTIATAFTRLNIRIAETQRDVLSIKADLDEHKSSNKCDIKDIKESVLRDSIENKKDHQRVVDSVSTLANSINDMKVEIVKAVSGSKRK